MHWTSTGRLCLLSDSPIISGALLAVAFPWPFGFIITFLPSKANRWICTMLPLACAILVLLALVLTQSRGAIVAVLAECCVVLLAGKKILGEKPPWLRQTTAFSVAALVLMIAVTPASSRCNVDTLSRDDSIRNRIQIWRACPALLLVSPLRGLGFGEAGYFYSQWFEDDNTSYIYTNVQNEFLELGIDCGLPFMGLCMTSSIAILSFPLFSPRRSAATACIIDRAGITLAAYLGFVGFIAAGMTSSFVKSPVLNAVMALDLLSFFAATGLAPRLSTVLWPCLRLGLLVTAGFMGALLGFGGYLHLGSLNLALSTDHSLSIRLYESLLNTQRPTTAIIVDRSVLGPLYGRTIRKWVCGSEEVSGICLFDPRFPLPPEALTGMKKIVLCGSAARFLNRIDKDGIDRVVLFLPDRSQVALSTLPKLFAVLAEHEDDCGLNELERMRIEIKRGKNCNPLVWPP